MIFKELTEKNLFLYAAKHYKNPRFADIDEFNEDLKRFKYVKRLLNRYLESDDLPYRLLLNHFIVIFNVFGSEAACNILELKLEAKHWPVVKPFLLFVDNFLDSSKSFPSCKYPTIFLNIFKLY